MACRSGPTLLYLFYEMILSSTVAAVLTIIVFKRNTDVLKKVKC